MSDWHWRGRPRVTCIVPAYNYAAYIGEAIDSALAQPLAEQMEIVVVDDGSTDDTPAVVGAYGERVRYVRKENGGLNSSVERGLYEARGEFITLLDADDVWPADRLTPLLDVMDSRPEVGLVYGDMNVIDKDGGLIERSFLEVYGSTPIVGRGFGELMRQNTVSGGASLFRASLAAVYRPIPPESAYPDWWLAVSISRVAELAYTPAVVNRYRWHGENMGLGREDKTFQALRDHELPFRRWMLGSVKPGEVPTQKLISVQRLFDLMLVKVAERYGVHQHELVKVSPEQDRKAVTARERAAAALRRGDLDSAVCCLVNALAHNPWSAETRAEFGRAWQGYLTAAPAGGAPVLEGVRGFATVAFADELVADPSLLSAYAEHFSDDDDATLIVWAPNWTPDEAITRLSAAIEEASTGREVDADVLVEAGDEAEAKRDALSERADAVLTRRPLPPFLSACPGFAPVSAGDLRGLAETRWLDGRPAAAL
jgi:glycosyltransferase involved in cell wall biosynthesis